MSVIMCPLTLSLPLPRHDFNMVNRQDKGGGKERRTNPTSRLRLKTVLKTLLECSKAGHIYIHTCTLDALISCLLGKHVESSPRLRIGYFHLLPITSFPPYLIRRWKHRGVVKGREGNVLLRFLFFCVCPIMFVREDKFTRSAGRGRFFRI